MPVSQTGIPGSTGQRHSVPSTDNVPLLVNNPETSVSHFAVEKDKADQSSIDKELPCSDVVFQPCPENNAVVVCSEEVLSNTVSPVCTLDKVNSSPELYISQSDKNVSETSVKHDLDASQLDNTLSANALEDSLDDELKQAEQSELVDSGAEFSTAESELVCSQAAEETQSVSDEHLEPVISETSGEVFVEAVGCEDVTTEVSIEHSAVDNVVAEPLTDYSSEVVDRTEALTDGDSCLELVEVVVVSVVLDEVVASAAEDRPCLVNSEEVPVSPPTAQQEMSYSRRYEDVDSIDDGVPVTSSEADHSVDDEQLPVGQSIVDECLPESPTTFPCQTTGPEQASRANTEQLLAGLRIGLLSKSETELHGRDVASSDRSDRVGFTIGESAITDGVLRRYSVDLAGRGVVLSRIAEESAAVAGGDDEDEEQHAAGGV